MEKIKCTPQEGTRLKAMVGNLIDCFPTGRIRRKDMERYNDELNKVMTELIEPDCCIFMSCKQAFIQSRNKDGQRKDVERLVG